MAENYMRLFTVVEKTTNLIRNPALVSAPQSVPHSTVGDGDDSNYSMNVAAH